MVMLGSEWWLVAKDNTEGYVPSIYLELANEDEASHELSPRPQENSPKSPETSPDSQVRSPDSQERSPEPQARSPDLEEGSPELEDIAEHIYEVVGEHENETGDGSRDDEEGGATCQVLFTFDASGEAELSVEEGEMVWLLKSHDLTGNSEWWLVQKEGGAKGFVPSNYLEMN